MPSTFGYYPLLLILVGVVWCAEDANLKHSDYRLPNTLVPEHYRLEIFTYLGEADVNKTFKFDGRITIKIYCVEPTNLIRLHAKSLRINRKSAHIRVITYFATVTRIGIKRIAEDATNDFLDVHLETELMANHSYELYLEYSSVLADSLAGFYRSSYVAKTSQQRHWLGVTQFEAISARKAFPCFDEPALKATFGISLARKNDYTTISNMPLLRTEPVKEKPGWSWDRYETSVRMSTYLVAFIVSDFGYKQSTTVVDGAMSNATFRIWARDDALAQVAFANDIGPKCLAYYEHYFNIPYPLPKQDMVAIPDFSAGAMENWGVITYREAYLLYEPNVSSTTSQHSVASVIAHELAHQWFGNLVTMKWWTDLWLNEGFATYMAGIAVHHLFGQWNSLEEEAVKNLLSVFTFDALKTSHPVSVPIGHPNEIHEIFDTISYKKGSLIIRMMSLFLGEETLRRGVRSYLVSHKFGNAEQDDLWHALTIEAHRNALLPKDITVKIIMDTWTLQTGYPVLHVERNYTTNSVLIRQERFLRDEIKTKEANCWWVPLSYTNEVERNFQSTMPKNWLSCPQKPLMLDGMPAPDKWILFNIQVAGIYKVKYDEANWKLLIKTFNSDAYSDIPTLNRVQLLDDAADLAWTGDLSYQVFFDLIQYLRFEKSYLPWKAALDNINTVNRQLKKSIIYGNFKNYMKQLLTPIYEHFGGLRLRQSKQLDTIKHQILIVSWACRFDVANCVTDAKAFVQKWQEQSSGNSTNSDENPVPKDLRKVIYCTALRSGGADLWEFIWRQYQASNVATEKNTILDALGCTREIWLLKRYLEWSLNEESGVRRQDSPWVFSSVAANDVGFYIAKNFFYSNIQKIYNYFSQNPRKISRYLAAVSSQINEERDANELKTFIGEHKTYVNEIKQGTDQSLETVKLNLQWQSRHFVELQTILQPYSTI